MSLSQPKRQWFILAYPIAYMLAWVVLVTRFLLHSGFPSRENGATIGNTLIGTALFSVTGFLYFPMGILGCFVWSGHFFRENAVVAIIAGWIVYLAVIGWGIVRPSWRVMYVFIALAVLNIAGCQFEHTGDAFHWSP